MMRLEDVEAALKVAITAHEHDAYAAAARIGWPDALLDLKEAIYELNEVNTFLLRRTREVHAADQVVLVVDEFLKSMPTSQPGLRDQLLRVLDHYRELRGLVREGEG